MTDWADPLARLIKPMDLDTFIRLQLVEQSENRVSSVYKPCITQDLIYKQSVDTF